MNLEPPQVVGVTGHQSLTPNTVVMVRKQLLDALSPRGSVRGLTSLARGTDQIFAVCVLELGGQITAVIPSHGYETSFTTQDDAAQFRRLLEAATEVIQLPFLEPVQEAFWAAGKEIVDRCDLLLAVWDGEPAGGLGGTADVVRYARDRGRPVEVIWPMGAARP